MDIPKREMNSKDSKGSTKIGVELYLRRLGIGLFEAIALKKRDFFLKNEDEFGLCDSKHGRRLCSRVGHCVYACVHE